MLRMKPFPRHRCRLLLLPLLLLIGIGLLGNAALSAAPVKNNVLFIVVDDLRPELGCYGAAYMHTPHLDQLAKESLLFERAYCQMAVCNPSRASVLSGARPDTTKVLANNTFMRPNMPDVVSLPQFFKNAGYTALSLGKVFHHSEREPGDDPLSWSEPAWYHGEPYRHWFTKESNDFIAALKKLPEDKRPKLFRAPPFEAAPQPDDVYPDGQTALKAIETLQQLKEKPGTPFFLAVGFVKPHLPFTCPQKYWDLYPEESIKLPPDATRSEGVPDPAFHNLYELRTYGGIPPRGDLDEATALRLIRGYRACVSFMDAQVGRVLAELDRLGLRETTLVVLWGDHGYHLGEHGLFTKMTNFELGTRVPLLMRVPWQGKSQGQRTSALVELVDLYPTLLELSHLGGAPAHLEGTSFAPLFENPARPWKKAAFSQYLRPGKEGIMGRSVRTAGWRYTEWKSKDGTDLGTELYDEVKDPRESKNLANDPAHAATLKVMANTLQRGWKAAGPEADAGGKGVLE